MLNSAKTEPFARITSDGEDDEFHDCVSQTSNANSSMEKKQQPQPRFRSLTNSRVPTPPSPSRNSDDAKFSHISEAKDNEEPVSSERPALHRSATTRLNRSTKYTENEANSFVEARARRVAKAMAEACTTGVSVREADERRGRVFGRLLVGLRSNSSSDNSQANDKRLYRSSEENLSRNRHHLKPAGLHQVASHNRIARLSCDNKDEEEESIACESDVPKALDADNRSLSMTNKDRKAVVTTRNASMEARIDRNMRNKFSQWIMCFGTVYFDVDQGPTLSILYPHVAFSETERAAICFSAMPDSTIYDLCDSVYTFNFRVDPVRLGLPKDQVFLYGHVFFRQKRDPLMRRGGFQRSVVIISHLPHHGLFSRMAYMVGPLYFDMGTAILEAAVHNVSTWPTPELGEALELPFLGTALLAELPTGDSSQLLETSKLPLYRFDPGEHLLASITCDGLFRSFRDILNDLWACWELMLLGEPLVVLADMPSRCSEAIVGLVDIIFPIRYCGDYRPYFTIQDPDFRAIVSKTHVPANTVVGVSNPFFSEALSHWPHKLFLGSSGRMIQMHGASLRNKSIATAGGGGGGSQLDSRASDQSGSNAAASSAPAANVNRRKVKQGLQTKRKFAIGRDQKFVDDLLVSLKTGKQSPWMVNNTLRRHFIDLTIQFLAPLNRYFATLVPQVHSAVAIPLTSQSSGASGYSQQKMLAALSSLSWFTPPRPLSPWRTDDFFESLATYGISPQLLGNRAHKAKAANVFASVFSGTSSSSHDDQITSNNNTNSSSNGGNNMNSSASRRLAANKAGDEWVNLYSQFLKCGNFATWLSHRTNEAHRALLARFRQEVSQGDVHAWCRGYDYPLALDTQQLDAEIALLDLDTMDLGQTATEQSAAQIKQQKQPHVSHVFYHGGAEDERIQAERHRQQILREQRARLANTNKRPVYGSDGTLVGYTRPAAAQSLSGTATEATAVTGRPQRSASAPTTTPKKLGQRITHARRAQHTMLKAAWQVAELLGPTAMARIPLKHRKQSAESSAIASELCRCNPPTEAESRALRDQLSILLEYMSAEAGCLFLPLVAGDYARTVTSS